MWGCEGEGGPGAINGWYGVENCGADYSHPDNDSQIGVFDIDIEGKNSISNFQFKFFLKQCLIQTSSNMIYRIKFVFY